MTATPIYIALYRYTRQTLCLRKGVGQRVRLQRDVVPGECARWLGLEAPSDRHRPLGRPRGPGACIRLIGSLVPVAKIYASRKK
jgi:hypothetical protein